MFIREGRELQQAREFHGSGWHPRLPCWSLRTRGAEGESGTAEKNQRTRTISVGVQIGGSVGTITTTRGR
jgi:hypothetical protein